MARAGTCTAGDRMRAVIYLAARGLRARWRGWAVLVLLLAVAGGAVLAAAAGARRTATAYPRFLTASKAEINSEMGTGLRRCGEFFVAIWRDWSARPVNHPTGVRL